MSEHKPTQEYIFRPRRHWIDAFTLTWCSIATLFFTYLWLRTFFSFWLFALFLTPIVLLFGNYTLNLWRQGFSNKAILHIDEQGITVYGLWRKHAFPACNIAYFDCEGANGDETCLYLYFHDGKHKRFVLPGVDRFELDEAMCRFYPHRTGKI